MGNPDWLFHYSAPGRRYATMTLHTADCTFVTSPKFFTRPLRGGWITEGEARETGDGTADRWDDGPVGQMAYARQFVNKAQSGTPQYALCKRCRPEDSVLSNSTGKDQ